MPYRHIYLVHNTLPAKKFLKKEGDERFPAVEKVQDAAFE